MNKEISWPESCEYYDGWEYSMGHKIHHCKHSKNKHSCMPCACPYKKIDELTDKIENEYKELKETTDTELIECIKENIEYLEKELKELMEG